MDHNLVRQAFRSESEALAEAMTEVSDAEWDLQTRCAPWSVRELLGHVSTAVDRIPGMLEAVAPGTAEISAAAYYRPDDRFSPQANDARIALGRQRAAQSADLAGDFTAIWRRADRLVADEPADRTVRTRHGDAMLLSDFLLTRVVELAVHGLDLSDALGRDPWLTAQAGEAVIELLLGSDHEAAIRRLGWEQPYFLRKATGREPLEAAESAQIERLGIQWLTLG